MENINIEAILDKHLPYPLVDHTTMYVKAAIKEIVEAVIDKCAEEAETKDLTRPNCDDHTPYRGPCISCSNYHNPDIIIGSTINKESILKVKEMINFS